MSDTLEDLIKQWGGKPEGDTARRAPSIVESDSETIPRVPFKESSVDRLIEEWGGTPSVEYLQRTGKAQEPGPEGQDPTQAFVRAIAASDNPAATLAELRNAEYIAKVLRKPVSEVIGNLDAISEAWMGQITPQPRFVQVLGDQVFNGEVQNSMGELSDKLRLASTPEEYQALFQQVQELEGSLRTIKDVPRVFVAKWLETAAASTPMMLHSMMEGGVTSMLAAGAGAAALSPAAAAAAPFTGGMSVPALVAAMGSVGMLAGSTEQMRRTMGGLSYWDMIGKGIPHDIAAPISQIDGLVQAALENVGQYWTLGAKIPGLSSVVKTIGQSVAEKILLTGAGAQTAMRFVARTGTGGVGEGVESFLQELATMAKDQFALELSRKRGLVPDMTDIQFNEIVDRVGKSFSGGFGAGVIFGVAFQGGEMKMDTKNMVKIRDRAKAMSNREAFIDSTTAMKPEDSKVSETAWRDYLGKVWDKQKRKPMTPAAAKTTQEATGPAAAATETATKPETAAIFPEGVERAKTGDIPSRVKVLDQTDEGTREVAAFGSAKERQGYITYTTTDSSVYIDDVVSEAKTEDITRQMVLQIKEKNPEKALEWNPVTEEQVAIREAILKDYPTIFNPVEAEEFQVTTRGPRDTFASADAFLLEMGQKFHFTPDQAPVASELIGILADAKGLSKNEYVSSLRVTQGTAPEIEAQMGENKAIGATAFVGVDGALMNPMDAYKGLQRATSVMIEAGGKADFHIFTHELFHAVTAMGLDESQVKILESEIGPRASWDQNKMEYIADRWEEYLGTGKAPTPGLQSLFEQLSEILHKLISWMQEHWERGGEKMSPALLELYNSLLATEGSGVQAAAGTMESTQEFSFDEEVKKEPAKRTTTALDLSQYPTQEIPVSKISISEEVPNFKEGSDESGVVEPLKAGGYVRLGTAPIVVWERLNGDLEIITGRHRLDLSKRLGEETIPSQVVREADGFTKEMAMTFDAESNIRDGQGSIKDYANYFRNTDISQEQASSRGLLARDAGRTGFAIGQNAQDGLYSLFRAGEIGPKKAAAIAEASGGDVRLQELGIAKQKSMKADELFNYISIVKQSMGNERAEQFDMFGNDNALVIEAEKISKEASKVLSELQTERLALEAATRLGKGERARAVVKYGFKPGDTKAMAARLERLSVEIEEWERWSTDSGKMDELRRRAGLGGAGGTFELSAHKQSEVSLGGIPEKTIPDQQPSNDPVVLWEMTAAVHEELVSEVGRLKTPESNVFVRPELKGMGRAVQKAEEYAHKLGTTEKVYHQIFDIDGATITADSLDDIAVIGARLHSEPGLVRMKNYYAKPTPMGYRALLANVKMSNGITVEIQVMDNNGHTAKEGPCHTLYEAHRELIGAVESGLITTDKIADIIEEIEGLVKGIYESAWSATVERASWNASSLDIADSLNSISEKLTANGVESILSGNTRKHFMELRSSAMGVPSQSTNTVDVSMPKSIAGLVQERKPAQAIFHASKDPEDIRMSFHKEGYEKPDIWKYKSEDVLSEKMKGPTPGKNVLSMLRSAGVKEEELRWTGLDEYLNTDKKLSPEEVLEYLNANKLDIEEVVKTDLEKTKFESYTLPGGENYREVLFTLPITQTEEAKSWVMYDQDGKIIGHPLGGKTAEKAIEQFNRYYGEESGIAVKAERETFKIDKPDYQSPHWEEPNVVAHTRLNDRTDAEGREMLFVEEIQSDWHQEGREKGYVDNGKAQAALDSLGKALEEKYNSEKFMWENSFSEEDAVKWNNAKELADKAKKDSGIIPDAPFKKTWPEFVFKRILREATENGYEVVGWTTGEQQAERYDLSKQINNIGYMKISDDAYRLAIRGKSGEIIYANDSSSSVTPNEMEDIIGKEMTQKILNGEGRKDSNFTYLEGLDLKVGGEGMKGFYDKMLVDYANKFGKKYGAKVEDVTIPTGENTETVHALPVTDEMREAISVPQLLFHLEELPPDIESLSEDDLYGNLSKLAAPYNTAEDFIKSYEEMSREKATPSQIATYRLLWNRAHPEEAGTFSSQQIDPDIPLPEFAEEYDHQDKIKAAMVSGDPGLSATMATGAMSTTEIDRRIAEKEDVLTGGKERIKELETEVLELQKDLEQAYKTSEEWQQYNKDLQKQIEDERAAGRATLKEEKKLLRTKMIAEKWAAIDKLKTEIRARDADRRAAVKYKAAIKKIVKKIMEPPSVSISYLGYAEEIARIQRGLDPAHHATSLGNPTRWEKERAASRVFFENNPEAKAMVDEKKLNKIYSVSLADMPLAELEELNDTIGNLRKLGKLKRSLELQQKSKVREQSRSVLANTVLRGEPPKEFIGATKQTPEVFGAWLKTLKPDRIVKLLDGVFAGVTEPGEFSRQLWERVNEEWKQENQATDARTSPIIKKMEELKLTADPFKLKPGYTYVGKPLNIQYQGETFKMSNGKSPTIDQAMYWYIGMQNERTAEALSFGNKYPQEVIRAGVAIVEQTPELKAFAEAIEKDGTDSFPRLRKTFIDLNNFDLPSEDHYVRMRRLKISYESRDDEMTAELTNRSGSLQKFVASSPAHKRLDIPEEYQNPIDDHLFSSWIQGVKIQEAYIHKSQMIRDLNSIFGSPQVTHAIQQKFGPDVNNWIRTYINFIASGEQYSGQQGLGKISRIIRSNAAIAWLSFNVLTASKQLTSTLDGLADAGPVHLLGAAAQFAAGAGKSTIMGKPFNNTLIDFVEEKSGAVKYRQPTREIEDLRNLDGNAYEKLIKKIGTAGMFMLAAEDKAASTIVWKAVYDKVYAETDIEQTAIDAADAALARSQPSSRPQDMAEIYRSGEVMKWFTMMTSDLSAKWNRLSFDVPAALRNGAYGNAIMNIVSISLSGLALAAMSGAFSGDDDEKKKKALIYSLFSQHVEALPIVGNDISSSVQRAIGVGRYFQSSGVKLIPAMSYLERMPNQFVQGQWDKFFENLAEGTGMVLGLPVSGPRRAIKAGVNKDWSQLLGWPAEEK